MHVRDQFDRCEGGVVTLVGIKGREQGRALLHDSDTGMGVAMDVALVALGHTEGAFEGEVVDGKIAIVLAGEQAWGEREHQLTHVSPNWVGALDVDSGQFVELLTTF
jgi:hypothetical protein